MKVKKEKPNNRNNKGFTLVEVLLAIVILSLVSAPILRGFIVTANTSARARKIMEATDVAQLIVEDVSAMSYEDDGGFVKTFLTDPDVSRDRLKSVSYDSTGKVIPLDIADFFTRVRDEAGADKKVFICTHEAPASDPKYAGYKVIALPNVDYDGEKYDALIFYKSNSSGSEMYFTYSISVVVFDQGGFTKDDGTEVALYHYRNQLVTLSTEITNKY